MKKILTLVLFFALSVSTLSGCGKKEDNAALKTYNDTMTVFFEDLVKINDSIADIDATSSTALDDLYAQFDAFQAKLEYLTTIKAPEELEYHESIDQLAVEGADYMKQANDYLHQAFEEDTYSENYIEPAMECYRRANKRVKYIISLIHGEVPAEAQ